MPRHAQFVATRADDHRVGIDVTFGEPVEGDGDLGYARLAGVDLAAGEPDETGRGV